MNNILSNVMSKMSAAQIGATAKKAIEWFKKVVFKTQTSTPFSRTGTIDPKKGTHTDSGFVIGGLYCYKYDPKWKNTLPYYDTYPITLILDIYDDGFMGLNFHYLPLKYRLLFLDKLMPYAVRNRRNEIMVMQLSYQILCATQRLKEFRPCLKRYLFNHVRSKIVAIEPNEWEYAIALPVHQFKKASPQEVWDDSINSIRNNP